jgi:hypothetical protein
MLPGDPRLGRPTRPARDSQPPPVSPGVPALIANGQHPVTGNPLPLPAASSARTLSGASATNPLPFPFFALRDASVPSTRGRLLSADAVAAGLPLGFFAALLLSMWLAFESTSHLALLAPLVIAVLAMICGEYMAAQVGRGEEEVNDHDA